MILVVAAVAEEIAFLPPHARVDILVTGVGPVEAAVGVAARLARAPYDLVINAGVAGAMRGSARIGDGVVVSTEMMEIELETGVALQLPGGAVVHTAIESDTGLTRSVVQAGFASVRGTTVSRVTATDTTAARLRERGVDVETMEGFAVLRAAHLAGVRAIELRGISNYIGDRANSEWNLAAGIAGLERVLTATLRIAHGALVS